MASQAFTEHLALLLQDAEDLIDAADQLPRGIPGRLARVTALNRAVIVTCVSAWEAYIEELVREALNALRPANPPLGLWPALNASVRGQLGRFNTPNPDNVRMLISDAIGLPQIEMSWAWQNCTSSQAVQRLRGAIELRQQIAHGVNPRPIVDTYYSSGLADFFRKLGRCTDRAVRDHLVNVLGIAHPWPL